MGITGTGVHERQGRQHSRSDKIVSGTRLERTGRSGARPPRILLLLLLLLLLLRLTPLLFRPQAHVMNDETQRKFLQSVKRLMTYAQKVRPADGPSQMVS